MKEKTKIEGERKFYGYKVAVACFIIMFACYGSSSTFAILLPEFAKDCNVSIAVTGYMATFFGIGGVIGNFAAGKLFKLLSVKRAVLIGVIVIVIGYVIYAMTVEIWHAYIGAVLLGFGAGLCALSGCAALIQEWFFDFREKIIGISFAGAGCGAAVCMFLCGQVIEATDRSTACWMMVAICGIIGIPIALFMIKDPQDLGQKALGWEKEEALMKKANTTEEVGISFKEAIRKPIFYVVFIATLIVGMLMLGFETYMPAYWQEYGVSVSSSATYLTIYYLIGSVMTMISGQIAQRVSVKVYIIYINVAFMIGAVFCVMWPSYQSIAFTALIIIFMSIAYPLFSSVPATITTQTFGNKDYATICSIFNGSQLGGSIVYPIVIGWCITGFGTMVAAYVFLIISSVAAILLILVALIASPYKKMLRSLNTNKSIS